ncbi:17-beta-hydroxysteroid dehydrogenase 14 [Bagarius yarrelli]|uniref:17-beta-hydroxysteroid dehydrogenase 14 n=1 Tax=Bagarius yarrelli TaxID=175774 RepID=A0A556UZK7_BAGYA|nr:17-beta-hydroxysteroid dehydrogenase 14 [Bagarius yarrelli]
MANRYGDKVVIVTGGSKGIGRGIVKVFVEAGKRLEEELNDAGPGLCHFLSCDMSKEEDIKSLIDVTIERFGQIDCLVNNAGWHPPHKPTDDTSADEFRDLLNLNLISYFLASKFALPYLRKTQGNIINVSSLVASIGQKHAAPYVATKGAIISMTKAMAVDESRYNVRVNCFSPGRMGTEEESGLVALFLAADATFCTGTELLLSGGAELNYSFKSQIP